MRVLIVEDDRVVLGRARHPESVLPGACDIRRVRFLLDSSAFATWSTADAEWVVYPGDYAIRVGMSSRDLPEEAVVTLPIP